MLNYISCLVLGAVALSMYSRAHFEFTRTIALAPTVMAGLELYLANVLEVGMFPVLTVLLTAFRVAMVSLCIVVLCEDAKMAKRREEKRRRSARQILCATHGIQALSSVKAESVALHKVA